MKYDKPVWQIMHQCADAMPDVFRYEDVRNWFADHYSDVNEATIRAHLIGLTEGGRAKHVQFAQRSPVFRRVARGEYAPIPLDERGEDPDAPLPSASKIKMSGNGAHREQPSSSNGVESRRPEIVRAAGHIADVILLGSVGERVNVPAPAKEVYRDVSFQLSRLDAEAAGSEWFVLSAEHGLVAPNEWMSPDSRTLADMEPSYRVTWANWVVTRLGSLVGNLDGKLVRVDAPDAFVGPLFAGLQEVGAVVSSGATSTALLVPSKPVDDGPAEAPEPLAAVEPNEPEPNEPEPNEPEPIRTPHADDPVVTVELDELPELPAPTAARTIEEIVSMLTPIGEITSKAVTTSAVASRLVDLGHALPAAGFDSLPESPGLYGWLVDPTGARELNRCLQLPVRAGLVFVGQVGGSNWHSLSDPVLNLRDHVDRVQLHGRARASTFRMTLATVLREHLKMTSLEDPRLTDWMIEHMSISFWATDDPGGLRELEQVVISELDPPLNVDHLPATEYRARLSQMRSALA